MTLGAGAYVFKWGTYVTAGGQYKIVSALLTVQTFTT
jgi:hypothetical protein